MFRVNRLWWRIINTKCQKLISSTKTIYYFALIRTLWLSLKLHSHTLIFKIQTDGSSRWNLMYMETSTYLVYKLYSWFMNPIFYYCETKVANVKFLVPWSEWRQHPLPSTQRILFPATVECRKSLVVSVEITRWEWFNPLQHLCT